MSAASSPWDDGIVAGLVRTVEEAAIASAATIGHGDRKGADRVAVRAMRRVLDTVPARGRVVIGEGERDRAPMLWSGEEFGCGDANAPAVDIAVDPLEGTNLCATDAPGAIAVLAAAPRGGLLRAPDLYMQKIVVGPAAAPRIGHAIRLDHDPGRNLAAIAEAEGRPVTGLTVVILDRSRHRGLVAAVRRSGARVRLIGDGDLSAGLLAATPGTGVHAVMGSGGAPEGVITAAALRCLGGGMLGRLVVRDDPERARLAETGVRDPDRVMDARDMARSDALLVCAAGVTDGALVRGVRTTAAGVRTTTLLLSAQPAEHTRITRFRPG